MHLTIVSASIREERKTHKVATILFNEASKLGINTHLIDLKEVDLPQYGRPLNSSQSTIKADLEKQINQSDKFIFVTPEYNGFFSSALKSFVDYFSGGPFKNKIIGTATVTSGPLGGMRAAQMMQLQILGLFSTPLPTMLLTGSVDQKISDEYEIIDPNYGNKVVEFINLIKDFN